MREHDSGYIAIKFCNHPIPFINVVFQFIIEQIHIFSFLFGPSVCVEFIPSGFRSLLLTQQYAVAEFN